MNVPRLHLLGPLGVVPIAAYPAVAALACAGGHGCDAAHVRLPGAPGGETLTLARAVRAACPSAALLINDRLDVALLAEADGAQLGEASIAAPDARRLLGARRLIGRSVHDLAGARQAAADGADFLLAGHVYDTPSKPGQPGRGLAWLEELAAGAGAPVIALGGVTVARVADVMRAGAWGVAMGRELLAAPDPTRAAHAARAAIETHRGA